MLLRMFQIYDSVNLKKNKKIKKLKKFKKINKYKHTGGPTGPRSPLSPYREKKTNSFWCTVLKCLYTYLIFSIFLILEC